ncbi:MAG: DUF2069 domain-containing protein [Thiohalorhabdus sp.]|uniref:DUF2069 domain-containing protein n=1 Tax=Thiohalorhabdus sp. TaxID=3094134 RepID=UPI0039803217
MRKLLAKPATWLSPPLWQATAVTGLLGLLFTSMAWALWWSPGSPYPIWMTIKSVPLLLPLRGLLHGRRRTAQWASFLPLPYLLGSILAVYGFLVPPHFTSAPDFVGAVLQGVFGILLMTGSMYYAYTTAGER